MVFLDHSILDLLTILDVLRFSDHLRLCSDPVKDDRSLPLSPNLHHARLSTSCEMEIAIFVLHGVIFVFCVAFQCIPVDSIWTQEGRKCLDTQALVYTGAAFNIFEDFMVMFLPVFELRGLNVSTKRRVALVFMFALGSLYVPLSSKIWPDVNCANGLPVHPSPVVSGSSTLSRLGTQST